MRGGLALAIASMVMLACPSNANAQTATWTGTVNGTTYNFSTITGTYADNASLLQSQVWWGDSYIAHQFSDSVNSNMGSSNDVFGGPIFVYDYYFGWTGSGFDWINQGKNYNLSSSWTQGIGFWPDQTWTFAIASPSHSSVAVPEIDGSQLPIAGFILSTFMLWRVTRRRREQQDSVGSLSFA